MWHIISVNNLQPCASNSVLAVYCEQKIKILCLIAFKMYLHLLFTEDKKPPPVCSEAEIETGHFKNSMGKDIVIFHLANSLEMLCKSRYFIPN